MAKKLNNLVVVSDLHVGCQSALCRPQGARMDGGGKYEANDIQKAIWACWREFWDEWVPQVCKGEPYGVVINGDALDGVHHNSTTQWSHNLEDQQEEAYEILKPVADKAQEIWMVRGTEAHTGQSGLLEEALAKRLGCTPTDSGQYARNELWKIVGKGLVHLMHHIGTTSSAQHEASAINAELTREYQEAGRWGDRCPDVVVRSHRHACCSVSIPCARGQAISIVTPGWQAKTPFAFRCAGSRVSQPQFGGILVRSGDEEDIFTRTFVKHPKRDRPE